MDDHPAHGNDSRCRRNVEFHRASPDYIFIYIYIIIYIHIHILYTCVHHVLTCFDPRTHIYTINDGDLNVTSLQMMVDKGNSLNMALCDVRSGWCMIYTSLFIQMYQSRICWFGTSQTYLVGGLEHEIYHFPLSWECHDPNWRSHIFQRGRSTTNQISISIINEHDWSIKGISILTINGIFRVPLRNNQKVIKIYGYING